MQISPIVFDFLTQVEQNNNREWFTQNKAMYESAFENVADFVKELIERMAIFDVSVRGQEPKDCFFRIYRDIRFSPDKRPYKTHFGVYIAQGGRKSKYAGYYLHIQNNMSVLAGGLWSPEYNVLKNIREEIYYAPEELVQIIENKEFKSTFGGFIDENSRKRPPTNYPADFQYAYLLKYRHYCVEKPFSNSEILAPDFLTQCVKTFKLLLPLNIYMNKLIRLNN